MPKKSSKDQPVKSGLEEDSPIRGGNMMPPRKVRKKDAPKSDITLSVPKPKGRPPIPVQPPKIPRIVQILGDPDLLGEIEDMAATGASLATIDARLKFPPNTMSKLLEKGKAKQGRPYYEFYLMFRSWVSEARHAAEQALAKRSPEKWLDRNSANKRLESEEDQQLALNAPSNPSNSPSPGIEAQKVVEALRILQEQGIDINEALSKGAITVRHDPNDKEDFDD